MAALTVWKFDTAEDAFMGEQMELIESNLSKDQEAQVREHFGTQA